MFEPLISIARSSNADRLAYCRRRISERLCAVKARPRPRSLLCVGIMVLPARYICDGLSTSMHRTGTLSIRSTDTM